MQIIPEILLISAAAIGAHVAAEELAYTFTDGQKDICAVLPWKWAKPIITCPPCMASVWGTVGHFYLGGEVWLWPVAVLSVAFTNTLFKRWVY
jgi:hypothetical protein